MGQQGGGSKRSGGDGESIVLQIPCGTSVYRAGDDQLLADMIENGQRLLVAKGGKGGRGNWEFRNPRNQTPMHATPGRDGQEVQVRLELKLIADIGLVGEPNAGKSTLLSVVTTARPKVADYPFTTLVPNLGIVDLGDYTSCTLADIPGLIEGASAGKGLGHEFLRHVERTRALLMMVDPSLEPPGRALKVLRLELQKHGNRLVDLPFAIAVTKADVLTEDQANEALDEARRWGEDHGALETLMISSVANQGLAELKNLLKRLYLSNPPS